MRFYEIGDRVRLLADVTIESGKIGGASTSLSLPTGVIGRIVDNGWAPKAYGVRFEHDDAGGVLAVDGYLLEEAG